MTSGTGWCFPTEQAAPARFPGWAPDADAAKLNAGKATADTEAVSSRLMASIGMSKLVRRRRANRPTYFVYIIELARDCAKTPCALAPLYVGQTAHTPEQRFAQHKAGGKLAAGRPHRFGVRLRYDLMRGIGPFKSRVEAEAAETAVARALERRGHRVFWG